MKIPRRRSSLLTIALAAAMPLHAAAPAPTAARAFTAKDLVTLNRVSDPQLSPDGASMAYTLREVRFDADTAGKSIWKVDVSADPAPPRRLTPDGSRAWSPRWAPDGRTLYFLSDRSGSVQLWALPTGMGEARAVTQLPLDIDAFAISPGGRHAALAIEVFPDCADLACTKKRLADRVAAKAGGLLYDKLFVRHWDTVADGRRSQLFLAQIDVDAAPSAEPRLLTRGIDGDVPSKPFGDDAEFAFAPDGSAVYFDARIAGTSEPWSTNFDIYSAATDGSTPPRNLTGGNIAWDGFPLPSPDGTKLYYLAMKRPMRESDRFGIMELDLASGHRREIDPQWDRNPGRLRISADGRTLYTTADDLGEHPLYAVDIATGAARRIAGGGSVGDFSLAAGIIGFERDALSSPPDLFAVGAAGEMRLTAVNAEKLKGVAFSPSEVFRFAGWNGETVQGTVVKPYGFEPGRKYPVAFLIHGGPQGSWVNDFHFRWNPQTYAGAGFAVVTIDFHGSTGYGQAFTDAISEHWGDRPLEDLEKGWAAALQKFPFLAGDRACALGASYGGYMINWIAGNWNTPSSGPWKCLVSHDGVFDTRMMYYATEELWFEEVEMGATPWEKPESYERFNPANHVAQWKVPMLVVQGAKDYRIPLEQGLGVFTALQRRGIPSELLVFPDENHWVLKPHDSLQWHQTVEAWLKRWTAP
jgi:dipeptidyl aminopeptidase/acylaminoacyl peptidase